MTIRGYVAIFYGTLAGVLSVVAHAGPEAGAHMFAVQPDQVEVMYLDEIEPEFSGDWEQSDLPAYLTEDESDRARSEDSGALAVNGAL
jgi:hypothetical protein